MVSIIVLSYNTQKLLEDCLKSIFSSIVHTDFEVIVVDNASSDDSVAMVRDKFKKVRLILNKENKGFAAGVNIGAAVAKGAFLFLLNSDTKFMNVSLQEMIDYARGSKNVGVMGGILVGSDGTVQGSFGKFFSLFRIFKLLFAGDRLQSRQVPESIVNVDWVNGACMLIRKDLFDELGGFDEHFFMYVEDVEFCYRVKKKGYQVVIYPYTKLLHSQQGSSSRSYAIVHIYKGLLYFFKKHRNTIEYMLVKFLLIAKAVSSIFIGTIVENSYLVKTYKNALKVVI